MFYFGDSFFFCVRGSQLVCGVLCRVVLLLSRCWRESAGCSFSVGLLPLPWQQFYHHTSNLQTQVSADGAKSTLLYLYQYLYSLSLPPILVSSLIICHDKTVLKVVLQRGCLYSMGCLDYVKTHLHVTHIKYIIQNVYTQLRLFLSTRLGVRTSYSLSVSVSCSLKSISRKRYFINMILCTYNIVKALYIKQETQKLQRHTIDEG